MTTPNDSTAPTDKHDPNTPDTWNDVFTGKRLPAPDDSEEHMADQARQVLLWRQAQQDTHTSDQQITQKQAQAYYHYVDNLRRHRRPPWYKHAGIIASIVLVVIGIALGAWYALSQMPAAAVSPEPLTQPSVSGTPTSAPATTLTPATLQPPVANPAANPIISPVDVGDIPAMVSLPGGQFVMGCSPGWDDVLGGCKSSERPPHPVSVAPFQIGRYEVTVGQFKQFVADTAYLTTAEQAIDAGCTIKPEGQLHWVLSKPHNWRNPGFPQTDQHPVVCISWQDTQHYLHWLNQKTGKHYRLPSEEEWEYAARGGKITAFYWGDQANRQFANYQGTGGADQWHYTAPVGQFSSNAFGLYDVAGNAWEWVKSCWRKNYLSANRIGDNACPSGTNAARARRGGGWDNYPPSIRSAYRNSGNELERSFLYSFRIAHDAEINRSP